MDLAVNTKALRAALSLAMGAVNNKSAMPLLACVQLRATQGALSIEAFDLALRVRTRVDAVVAKPGACAINAKWLAAALGACGAEAALTVVKDKLRVKSGARKVEAPWWPDEDFPPAPTDPPAWQRMPDGAQAVIARALAFASQDLARESLCCVYLSGTHAAATNGHFGAKLVLASEVTGLLPQPFAALVSKLDGTVYLAHHARRWFAQSGETVLSHPEVDAVAPNLDYAIPAPGKHGAKSKREALLAEAQAVEKLTFERAGGVLLTPGDGLVLHATDADGRDYSATAQCETHGKTPVMLGAAYFATTLGALTGEEVALSWDGDLEPIRFESGADVAVVMCMRHS